MIFAKTLFGCLVTGFIMAFLLTPVVRRLGILDRPNYRKIHDTPTPKAGGLAVAVAMLAAMLVWGDGVSPVLVLVVLVALLGLWDDVRTISPIAKLLGQLAIATATVMFGFYFEITGMIIDQVVSVVWLVAVMNAVNLIDGMDGLASGVAVIALGAFLTAGVVGGLEHLLIVSAAIGACLAFLWFNWHPARIFLGDTGSLMLGYLLGFSAIMVSHIPDTHWVTTAVVVFLILAFPLFDMFLTIIRRWRLGQPIFAPDRSHTYNLVVDNLEWSVQKSVLFFYAVCFIGGVAGIAVLIVGSSGLSTAVMLMLLLGMAFMLCKYSRVSSVNEFSPGA